MVTPRKLVFFVIDDSDLVPFDDIPIDIWHPAGERPRTDRASVSGWIQHCEQAHAEKAVSFDALSIDVNFSRDRSDPMWSLHRPASKDICAGLYHGLLALARRRGNDDHGNALPCAREVGTMSPTAHFTVEQEVEIARVYGLLLALASPGSAESGFMGLGDDDDASPADLVLAAFRAQPSRTGAAIDTVVNLLPQWRDAFVAAVGEGRVAVDFDGLKKLKRKLADARRRATGVAGILDAGVAVVTLLNRDRVACEAILLRSIFADQRVVTDDDYGRAIEPWIARLLRHAPTDLSGFVGPTVEWIAAAGCYRAERGRLPDGAPQRNLDFRSLDIRHRMLILVSYHVASRLDSRRFPPAEQPDLAAAFGTVLPNYQYFRRTLKATIDLCSVANLDQLDAEVLQRMGDPGFPLRFAPELSQALANVLYESDLEAQVRAGFPALVPFLDCAGG